MLCTRTALADNNLEAVAVSEGVPYRISQELPGIPSNESILLLREKLTGDGPLVGAHC